MNIDIDNLPNLTEEQLNLIKEILGMKKKCVL